MTNGDIRVIQACVKHLQTVFKAMPSLPYNVSTKAYNAYRLLQREDVPRLKRKLTKWEKENTSTIGLQTQP